MGFLGKGGGGSANFIFMGVGIFPNREREREREREIERERERAAHTGQERGVGLVVVGFHVFGAPRFQCRGPKMLIIKRIPGRPDPNRWTSRQFPV